MITRCDFFCLLQPWETYQSNLSIDLTKHHVPKNFLDKVAYRTVKLLRIPTDLFFKVCNITFGNRLYTAASLQNCIIIFFIGLVLIVIHHNPYIFSETVWLSCNDA